MAMKDKLDEAIAELLLAATKAFTASADHAKIKESTAKLTELLNEWNQTTGAGLNAVRGLLRTVRSNCDHAGAATGYNERDGSWMAPCPHCGATA